MFKYFLIALVSFYFGINPATAQVLCFKSENIKGKCIRLQLTLPEEGSKLGKIKYENGSNEIGIQRIKENILSGSKKIPATVKTEFAEIIDEKRVGTYLLVTQGAVVGEAPANDLRDCPHLRVLAVEIHPPSDIRRPGEHATARRRPPGHVDVEIDARTICIGVQEPG